MRRSSDRRCAAMLCAWIALIGMVVSGAGCSRSYYRQQADREAYQAIEQKATDPRWPLEGYTIEIDPRSRLYDPTHPDCPPMPPDDPVSHELMHCVDCKAGFPCWHRHGDLAAVDDRIWEVYLPRDEQGRFVLDRQAAIQLALLNSTDFQEALEELYLSALDVSFERFRFDAQFFGGSGTFFTSDGRVRGEGASSSILNTDTDLRMQRLFAAGGELVVGVANSFIWQFSGPNSESVNTLLDFSLIQPLLRVGGRARVLERLTISERALLANIRQMERFRRGFYLEIMVGRNAGAGPQRRGGFFGGAGLEGFSGVGGGGFGRVGGFGGAGLGGFGAGVTGTAGAAQAQGFFGLLQQLKQIQNQEAVVAGLRDSLAQLEASYEANRIDRFQVDQTRQALFQTQSELMILKVGFETDVDQLLGDLGLPPDIAVRIDDPLLDRFELIDPRLTRIQNELDALLGQIRSTPPGLDTSEPLVAVFADVRRRAAEHITIVEQDFETLEANRPARRESLMRLLQRPELTSGVLDPPPYDVDAFEQRVQKDHADFAGLLRRFDATFGEIDRVRRDDTQIEPEALRRQLRNLATELSAELGDLLLLQARVRLDGIVLVPVELDSRDAIEIARVNRRDWMNARATVVDTWRLIEFNANDLKSGLDLVFSGDISNTQDDPFRFRNSTGRLRVGLEFDAPLTRVSERNVYRQALIEYQQARRNYMQITDAIKRGLRNGLRTVELNQLNFEIRRAAVAIAISQVELARLRLTEPPQPEVQFQLGATTARDLVDALQNLTRIQNEFLSVWVSTEVQRMGLDLDLGTMQLDQRGLWIDPGPITADRAFVSPGQEHQPAARQFDLQPIQTAPDLVEPAVTTASLRADESAGPWWWPEPVGGNPAGSSKPSVPMPAIVPAAASLRTIPDRGQTVLPALKEDAVKQPAPMRRGVPGDQPKRGQPTDGEGDRSPRRD